MSEYHDFDLDLAGLPALGKHWKLDVPSDLLQADLVSAVDAVVVPCTNAHWCGKIVRSGDVFRLEADFALKISRRCDRCLEEFDWSVKEHCQRDFRMGQALEDEESEILAHPGRMNLLDVLREEIWLAWRPVLVCSEACQGLCQDCGKNLNHDSCQCGLIDDSHPFAALKKLHN